MNIEDELMESLRGINNLQQEVAEASESLEGQLNFLEKKIEKLWEKYQKEKKENTKLELIRALCLLSELASAVDFDRMIEAREKFRALLPKHFEEYLSHLDALSWEITWSGCLDCRHFLGRCNLGLTPVEVEDDEHRLEKTCPSHAKRSRKV